MTSSKQLFQAAKELGQLAATAQNAIVREALAKAQAEATIKATDQLTWEVSQLAAA